MQEIYRTRWVYSHLSYEEDVIKSNFQVPELAGFWMLSMLLQFPLQGFLLFNPSFRMYIFEKIVQSIMMFLLLMQLVTGFVALRAFANTKPLILKWARVWTNSAFNQLLYYYVTKTLYKNYPLSIGQYL